MTGGICFSEQGAVHFAAGAAVAVPTGFPGNRLQLFSARWYRWGRSAAGLIEQKMQSYNLCREKRTEGTEKNADNEWLVSARNSFKKTFSAER